MSNKSNNNWTNWHHQLHKEILQNQQFIPNGIKLLIAVSGGQDSMALLSLFEDMKDKHQWTIDVWHGNHQWHKASDVYAKGLSDFCLEKQIPFHLDTVNGDDVSTEEKARNWRYQKLCKKASSLKNETEEIYILTGHTSTDNVETFMLNLARGSNYSGLKGIPKKRLLNNQYFLVRPLLSFSREDTLEICKVLKNPIWEDPTNSDIKLKRNLIRKNVLTNLEVIYPGCIARINRFIYKMNQFNSERTDLCCLALNSCMTNNGLKKDIFNNLGLEARSTLLNAIFRKNSIKQISAKNIDSMSERIAKSDKGQINLPNGIKIIWNKKFINLEN